MSKKRMGGDDHGDEGHGHGDRPWVYFMVDCFFLITEFFILTFKFKVEDYILPGKMPPGSISPSKSPLVDTKKQIINISVSREGANPVYEVMKKRYSFSELSGVLSSSAGSGQELQVRVSYEANTPWTDVAQVFNECQKFKISECGLIPLRGSELGKPAPK